jgi:hypothetical protein
MSNNSRDNAESASSTSKLVESVDQMVRLPLEMTGATWDLMMQGVQGMTQGMQNMAQGVTGGQRSAGTSQSSSATTSAGASSSSSWTEALTGQSDQDLSGDDLKYVMWSIVFTKPGFEAVLEPQHEEIVNYSADGASFAALKIAKFLERSRHGHNNKPESWGDTYPPRGSAKASGRRTETITATPGQDLTADISGETSSASSDRGWRIPAEDHKYITFIYRVDRRLPKQETEVTRVERVTIERGGSTKVG